MENGVAPDVFRMLSCERLGSACHFDSGKYRLVEGFHGGNAPVGESVVLDVV